MISTACPGNTLKFGTIFVDGTPDEKFKFSWAKVDEYPDDAIVLRCRIYPIALKEHIISDIPTAKYEPSGPASNGPYVFQSIFGNLQRARVVKALIHWAHEMGEKDYFDKLIDALDSDALREQYSYRVDDNGHKILEPVSQVINS